MKTEINNKKMLKRELENIQKLHRAENIAWLLFIGVGITYILLTILLESR
ncbi:MAG: hypothetical protein WDZ35_07480 [Crocinitomicaceae bacterium]